MTWKCWFESLDMITFETGSNNTLCAHIIDIIWDSYKKHESSIWFDRWMGYERG